MDETKPILSKGEIMKSTLGIVEYFEMVNFFDDIYEKITSEKSIAIFTTRRCHLLFYLYCKEIRNINIDDISNTTCISDKAIHFYAEELKYCSAYIIDDILIHGRTLLGVIRRVENYCKNINVEVYAQNKECEFKNDIKDELERKNNIVKISYNSYKIIDSFSWRNLSNRIVASLILTSTPYVAYSYAFFRKNISKNYFDNIHDKLINTENVFFIGKLDLSLNETKRDDEINQILSENIISRVYKIADENAIFSCLRIYYNNLLNEMVVLPFSFNYPYFSKDIDYICNLFFEEKTSINNVNKEHPKYRALTSLYSFKFFKEFNDKFEIFNLEEFEVNNQMIQFNYYADFFSELKNALDKNIDLDVFGKKKKNININFDNYSNNQDIYVSAFCERLLDTEPIDFIKLIKEIDHEEEFKLKNDGQKLVERKRQKGLPIEMIFEAIRSSKLNLSIENFICDLIAALDTGLVSIYPEEYGDGNFCNYCITGEQACRLYQDQYTVFLKKMINIFKYSQDDKFGVSNSDYNAFIEYINKVIEEENIPEEEKSIINDRLSFFGSIESLDEIVYLNQCNSYLDAIYWKRI